MKYLRRTILFFILIGIISAFKFVDDYRLKGTWKSLDTGVEAYIDFSKDGYITFNVDNENFGGKSFDNDSFKACMKYETSDSSVPASIDLIVYRLSDMKEVNRSRGIYRLIGSDSMQMCLNFETDQRIQSFETGECQLLKKIK
jgi:hypothetical protein